MSEQRDEHEGEGITGSPHSYLQFLEYILLNLWPLVVLAFLMAVVIILDYHQIL
jgi:hypothetical protein